MAKLGTNKNEVDPNDPSQVTAAYAAMMPSWDMIGALLGGTASMREAGEDYMPRHPRERDDVYSNRLNRAVLTNYVSLTLDHLSGKPFIERIKMPEEISDEMEEFLADVDMQGNDINAFSYDWFKMGLQKAYAYILVDFPPAKEGATLRDEEGMRPYWVLIDPEDMLGIRVRYDKGREVVTHVRYRFYETLTNGFSESYEQRIRVLNLIEQDEVSPKYVRYETYTPVEDPRTKKIEWRVDPASVGVMMIDRNTPMPHIPVVGFYADRKGLQHGKPPLEDLAYLNVRHWQSDADQQNVLTVARFPMLAGTGVSDSLDDEGDQIAVGPHQFLGSADPAAKFYYVEHTGAAIDAGDKDLQNLEAKMAMYGAQMLKKRPDRETATGRVVDELATLSPLQRMALSFNDALNYALYFTALWRGEVKVGGEELPYTIGVNVEFGLSDIDERELNVLLEARKNSDLSGEQFLTALVARGILGDTFDMDENREQVENERTRKQQEQLDLLDRKAEGQNGSEPAVGRGRSSGASDEGTE